MSTAQIEVDDWISGREASRLTGFSLPRVRTLGEQGFLTIRRPVAGSMVKYSRASCEALVASAVVPASKSLEAVPA